MLYIHTLYIYIHVHISLHAIVIEYNIYILSADGQRQCSIYKSTIKMYDNMYVCV